VRPARLIWIILVVCSAEWANHGEVYAWKAGHRPGCPVPRSLIHSTSQLGRGEAVVYVSLSYAHASVEWRLQQLNHVCLREVSFCDYFEFNFNPGAIWCEKYTLLMKSRRLVFSFWLIKHPRLLREDGFSLLPLDRFQVLVNKEQLLPSERFYHGHLFLMFIFRN